MESYGKLKSCLVDIVTANVKARTCNFKEMQFTYRSTNGARYGGHQSLSVELI